MQQNGAPGSECRATRHSSSKIGAAAHLLQSTWAYRAPWARILARGPPARRKRARGGPWREWERSALLRHGRRSACSFERHERPSNGAAVRQRAPETLRNSKGKTAAVAAQVLDLDGSGPAGEIKKASANGADVGAAEPSRPLAETTGTERPTLSRRPTGRPARESMTTEPGLSRTGDCEFRRWHSMKGRGPLWSPAIKSRSARLGSGAASADVKLDLHCVTPFPSWRSNRLSTVERGRHCLPVPPPIVCSLYARRNAHGKLLFVE